MREGFTAEKLIVTEVETRLVSRIHYLNFGTLRSSQRRVLQITNGNEDLHLRHD